MRSRARNLIVLLLSFEVISLLLLYLQPSEPNLLLFRIFFGISSLIMIPGYCLMRFLPKYFNEIEIIGLTLIMGVTYQLLIIYLMFFISIFIRQFNFQLVISLFSIVPILVLHIAQSRNETPQPWITSHVLDTKFTLFCVLLIIGLIIRSYYQIFSVNPHTDTSLCMEMARNLFVNGEFTSKIIHDTMPMYHQLGFNSHYFVYFLYALFFMIGGVSYLSVKIATIFYGVLIFFPVFSLINKIFNDKIALGAVTLISFHPIIVFFSSIPINGSEIIGTLYLFSTIYFIFLSIDKKSNECTVIAGLFAFAMFATRTDYFYVFILILPILFITFSKKIPRLVDLAKICLFSYPLFLTRFIHFPTIVMIMSILNIAFIVWWLRLRKRHIVNVSVSNMALFNIIIFSLYMLYILRFHNFPQLLEYATIDVMSDPVEKGLYGLGLVNYNVLLSRFTNIWQINSIKLTAPILFLSFISIASSQRSKQVASLLSYPVAYSVVFSLTSSPIGGVDHHRFHLASYYFLVSLAAFSLMQIYTTLSTSAVSNTSFRSITIKVRNRKLLVIEKSRQNSAFILIVLVIVLFIFIGPLYRSELKVIENTDIRSYFNYDPAIKMILEHTPQDSVLMTRKPYEFALFTDRVSKSLGPSDLNIEELRSYIKSSKTNYLIADELFIHTYTDQEVRNLYLNSWSEFGFIPVYISSTEPHVVIYNVTSIWSGISTKKTGPKIEVIADNSTLMRAITIEYFDPREATCFFELYDYSTYNITKIPMFLFFESIHPAPRFIHIGEEEIMFEGDPSMSYIVLFKANLLLELGWKDSNFLKGWTPNWWPQWTPEMTFESDGKTLVISYNNTSPTIVWALANKRIDHPVSLAQFPYVMVRFRHVKWSADNTEDVYTTVRLYDHSGILEETPLINPSNEGEWRVAQIPIKYLSNIAEIVFVARTGPETSITVEIDYIAITNVRNYWMDY